MPVTVLPLSDLVMAISGNLLVTATGLCHFFNKFFRKESCCYLSSMDQDETT